MGSVDGSAVETEAGAAGGGAADVVGAPICDHAFETRQCQIEGSMRGWQRDGRMRRGRVTTDGGGSRAALTGVLQALSMC